MDDPSDNPYRNHGSEPEPNSLQNTRLATVEEITTHLTALGLQFWVKDMPVGAQKTLLRQMCSDLLGRCSEPQLAHATSRWRTEDHPRRFPISGELLALMKNPYADTPRKERHGGGCQCERCRYKIPNDGFYKAPGSAYVRDLETQAELDEWMRKKVQLV
jgi:hypothetical protein